MTTQQSISVVWNYTKHLARVVLALSVWAAMLATMGVAGSGLAVSPFQETPMVKVTPLGSHAGDSCRDDRALLFEDPTGVRVLWDPGRTIEGGTDGRLADVHVVILSHLHTDHIGDRFHQASDGCGGNATGASFPQSNVAAITAAKNAAVLVGGEMPDFLARKIQNIRGAATPGCPAAGLINELTVPRTSPCTASLRPGGSRTVRMTGASTGVKIVSVPAFHSNGIPSALVDTPGVAPGTTGYGGNEGGYLVRFTNGLTVYLTGDTGLFGDMDTIIRRFYQPNLVVVNMSDVVTLGPEEAAFAVKDLIQPRSVIPSHVNEQATQGGVVRSGTRTERLIQMLNGSGIDVVVPLSGVTRQFDGSGHCVNCQ
jgi:L-ascorbate metabolism protein UlaG (beta-lactamase superfamily)